MAIALEQVPIDNVLVNGNPPVHNEGLKSK